MKKFNINHEIWIQITGEGWKHLKNSMGDLYIKECIESRKVEVKNETWYKLQAHHVFSLFPINFSHSLKYKTNVLIEDKDLSDYCH